MSAGLVPGTTPTTAIPPVDPPKPSRGQLGEIAGISIAVLATPFILWGVWILVSRKLRAWRVRSVTPGSHCIGTWYGGVDAKKHAETLRTRQIRKANSRSDRFSTDSPAAHNWIFWDSSREKRVTHAQVRRKSILRFLPSWTRNYSDGSAINTTTSPNSLSIAEEGLLFNGCKALPRARAAQDVNAQLTADSYPSRSSKSRNSRITFSPDTTSDYGNCRPWRIRSHGITPADASRCLIPQKMKETSNIPSESSASLLTRKKIRAPRASAKSYAIANRTCSPPATLSSNYGRMKRWFSEPYGLEMSSNYFVASPKLYRARNPEGPVTPQNSDELLGSGSATPQLRHSLSDSEQVEFNAREVFAEKLRERLIVWAKPLVLNPYKSTGYEYSGIDGRPTSPSMGWLVGRESAINSSANFDRKSGNEILIQESAIPGCSTRSSASIDRASVHEARNRASDGAQASMGADSDDDVKTWRSYQSLRYNAEGSCSSDGAFQGSYSPGKLRLISSLLPSKWFSLPTRRIQVLASNMSETQTTSPIEEIRLDQISHDWSLKGDLKVGAKATQPNFGGSATSNKSSRPLLRKTIVGSARAPIPNPRLRYYKLLNSRLPERHRCPEEGPKPAITSQSTPEQVFLDELDRRLNRLDYELSPGFRGPRSRESAHRSRWQSAPSHFHVLDGMSQPIRPNPGRWSLDLPPPTPIPDMFDMQAKKTKPRNKQTSLANRDLVRPKILLRVDSATATATATITIKDDEPREGAIDTAAWILRRPPMDARPSHTAEQALLYTDGRGTKPKPLAAWQQLSP